MTEFFRISEYPAHEIRVLNATKNRSKETAINTPIKINLRDTSK